MSTGMEVTLNARYGRNPCARKPRMRMFLMSIENHSCSISSEPKLRLYTVRYKSKYGMHAVEY